MPAISLVFCLPNDRPRTYYETLRQPTGGTATCQSVAAALTIVRSLVWTIRIVAMTQVRVRSGAQEQSGGSNLA